MESKKGNLLKCFFYLGAVLIFFSLLIANVIMTHANNTFRMSVASGVNLEQFYCADTLDALKAAGCIVGQTQQ